MSKTSRNKQVQSKAPFVHVDWTPELVDSFWDGLVDTGLLDLSFAKHASKLLLDIVEPHLSTESLHLDFGAGDGDLVEVLIEKGYRAAAYEPSERRRERLLKKDFTSSEQFLGIVDKTAETQVDVVFCCEVIEHISDDGLGIFLESMRNFLRPGGTLILTTPNTENLEQSLCYCPKCRSLFHRWQHVQTFSAERLEELLHHQGLRKLHIHKVDFSNYAHDLEELKSLRAENRLLRRYGGLGAIGMRLREFYQQNFKGEESRGASHLLHKLKKESSREFHIGNESHLIYVGKLEVG